MLIEGGDTDTNAAIVGGMIGALVGFNNIPQDMIKSIMEFDCCDESGNKLNNCQYRE
jgi:ADP-ribosylglycohydrolase